MVKDEHVLQKRKIDDEASSKNSSRSIHAQCRKFQIQNSSVENESKTHATPDMHVSHD